MTMKKRFIRTLSLLLAALLLTGCGGTAQTPEETQPPETEKVIQKIEGSSLYVEKVENLPEDFILGMDASAVPSLEAGGVKYYDFDASEQDVFLTLAENGINYIRVRVWNHPYDAQGNGYGGGNCDIQNALEIGKRATAAGMKLLVDFHYSDFWADPGKQMAPLAWKDMEIEEKTQAVYDYTKESLQLLKDAGVDVGMVQVGNETNGSLCGERVWMHIYYLMDAGSRAIREVFPEALIAVHFANPEKPDHYRTYARKLDYYQLDYDVFASSYYPYWHGTLENLSDILTEIHDTYDKKVMVMETSYAFTGEDSDFYGNTISDGSAVSKPYPYTIQGQARCVRDVVQTVASIPEGIGVVYWEGTWISAGGSSWEENQEKWETFGSGWASSYAGTYDPKDAGKYHGGCAVDNQAFFDAGGKPLESLRVFNLLRFGNQVSVAPDALEDVTLLCDIGSPICLPETVNAVMNDGSTQAVPVQWQVTEQELEAMAQGGVAKYTVEGTAGGMTARAYVSVVEVNYLENHSFETGDLTGWTLTELGSADELYVEDKLTDSLTGKYHMHFWSAAQNSVEFTLEQTMTDLLPAGYRFRISIMGGDCGETEIYAYVKINGEMVSQQAMTINGYGNWDTASLEGITVSQGDVVTAGVYVRCQGAGAGAWGKIDDGIFNKEQ